MPTKKYQLKVEFDREEIEVIRSLLAKKGMTWTQFVRALFKLPAKNPRPCAQYHASKGDVSSTVP